MLLKNVSHTWILCVGADKTVALLMSGDQTEADDAEGDHGAGPHRPMAILLAHRRIGGLLLHAWHNTLTDVLFGCACMGGMWLDPRVQALLALGFDREDAEEFNWRAGQCSACQIGGGDEASVLECSYCQRDVCKDCLGRCEQCLALFCPTCTTIKYITPAALYSWLDN